ncbi:two component transcriptional regulator sigma54 specific Fis/NtrC/NtrX [Gluconobacter thailandicus F149-1 = NBRC 100600]|uniref:nitrogen assimilation response regulator NtrX n=1 Tax=Gluconobacter thailandicus TaxID=257438 RepID=UPI0005E6C701|nr:sigma-54 dependent transcriptional regulator [Gluconobacter thailandicus]KXV54045.1 AAA family ATPase [Gluconobacter thailandicus]GAN94366.1 two component transcriptional regulator sigma54 specific Fis/NtrC/NtrX [Gluconobacter thailandicus F149-1 = NBRC 100600]GBR61724.1 two component response regulator NtrX [Gluconobacter thailandicus F149-1 = NBRC 100600]GEL88173.1 sigma-54-dependent Fis family transcriptional regulator [Gluconobacter thailandicus F149-1 = NBRC 100600]
MEHEILIVDDEPDIRFLIEGILNDEGYATRTAANSDQALELFRANRPSLAILDIWLQGSKLDGLELLKIMQAEEPGMPALMISGHGTIETAVASLKHGAYDFIEKPFQSDRLLVVVQRALEAARLQRENAELRLRAGPETTLSGEGAAVSAVRGQIERVAPTNSRVLITGPAGSGKEVAARMIHARSRRAEGPFVALNCATLAPNRFEEELFGLEGSDGQPARRGVLERSHRGTLLLDEVANMPLETQGKIVRALQDQTFERIGGNTRIKVDVRVIATTNRDLQSEIMAHRFREDLYYRLAVVPLRIPSLRERREDIPGLAKHFLERCAQSSGLPIRELSVDALAALQAYEWPGNVRELRNLMERLLIMMPGSGSDPIRADMLPSSISQGAPSMTRLNSGADVMSLPLREARDLFETQYLQVQLMRLGGNISRTANFVCMERSALHRKLKQLGVTTQEDRSTSSAVGS